MTCSRKLQFVTASLDLFRFSDLPRIHWKARLIQTAIFWNSSSTQCTHTAPARYDAVEWSSTGFQRRKATRRESGEEAPRWCRVKVKGCALKWHAIEISSEQSNFISKQSARVFFGGLFSMRLYNSKHSHNATHMVNESNTFVSSVIPAGRRIPHWEL